MLTLYRRLLALRRAEPALTHGSYHPVAARQDQSDVLAYRRRDGGREFLVVLNLASQAKEIQAAGEADPLRHGHLVLSTHLDREGELVGGSLNLRADEGVIVSLPPSA